MDYKSVLELRADLQKYKAKCEKMVKSEGKNQYLNAKKNVETEISKRHIILLKRASEFITDEQWVADFNEQVI